MSEQSEPEPYSKAFETLIQEPDGDIVGLLAYAFFKGSIRERVRAGQDVPRHLRNPTKSEIDAYRGRAERILEQYAERAVEDARPGITSAAQGAAKGEIIAEIKSRTGLGPAIVAGVVVWAVTIILTIVAVFAAPEWVRALIQHATPR